MSIGVGGIVSLGGGSSSGGGSGSGITSINSQTGPSVVIAGVNGIVITAAGNVITINGAALSGISSGGGSSISAYTAAFTNITSGLFQHNFGSRNVLVQVFDNSLPPRRIEPDETVLDTLDAISLLFNQPQTGFVVIHGPSGSQSTSITKFAASFTSITSGIFTHNLATTDVLVQVYDDRTPKRQILADDIIIENINQVSVIFNRPQTGRIVII